MIYVFDSCAFITLFENYYHSRFPTLWNRFDILVEEKRILSVREVKNEILSYHGENILTNWANNNTKLFEKPNEKEIVWVKTIFKNKHFQTLINKQKMLKGGFVADPFIVAKAKVKNGIVITQEKYKENAAKVPNVCEYLEVQCMNLEGFMEKENWIF